MRDGHDFTVRLTVNRIKAEDPEQAVDTFQDLIGFLPEGTVLYVRDDETGEETEVEI